MLGVNGGPAADLKDVGQGDCPCHGSRYDPADGHVLNGPAISGLEPAEE